MAKIKVEYPTELSEKMNSLGKEHDRIMESCLKAAAIPVKQAAYSKFDAVVGRPHVVRGPHGRLYNYGARLTGTLRRSIGISKVRIDRKGNHDVKIGFADAVEPTTKIRCGYLAAIIERGVLHGRRNQPPRPFIKPAEQASKQAAGEAFLKTFDEEYAKL